MTFTNKTDYPDFTEIDQSGNGIVYQNASLAASTVGPFYVGNLSAITVTVQPTGNGSLAVWQQDTTIFGGFAWGQSFYDLTGVAVMYDEVKVSAPYLFLQWAGSGTADIQALQSRGGKGAPGFNENNILYEDRPFTINANTAMNATIGIVLPGPAFACAVAGSVGVPVLKVFDTSGGNPEGVLGFAQGAAASMFGSGCQCEFVAQNAGLIVQVGNIGATDTNFSLSVVSTRGY